MDPGAFPQGGSSHAVSQRIHNALYVMKWQRAFQRKNSLNQDTEPITGMEWAGLGTHWMWVKHEERSGEDGQEGPGEMERKAMERIKNIIWPGCRKVILHIHVEVVVDYKNSC